MGQVVVPAPGTSSLATLLVWTRTIRGGSNTAGAAEPRNEGDEEDATIFEVTGRQVVEVRCCQAPPEVTGHKVVEVRGCQAPPEVTGHKVIEVRCCQAPPGVTDCKVVEMRGCQVPPGVTAKTL